MKVVAAILFLLALFACSPFPASNPPTQVWLLYQNGLPRQATVLALAVDPHDPRHVFAGTYDDVGAYESADGGTSWRASVDGLDRLAVFTLNWSADGLIAGTTDGLYRLTNDRWSRVDGIPEASVYAIARGADGALYAATDAHGIFASADSRAWERIPGLDGEIVLSIAALDDQSLIAGTSGEGAYITRNRGRQWYALDEFRGDYVSAIAVDPHDPRTIFLRTRAGLFRSGDAASTWQKLAGGVETDIVHALLFDDSARTIHAATGGHGVLASDDEGDSWRSSGTGLPDGSAVLALAQLDEQTLLAGTQTGVYLTRDAGRDWIPASDGLGSPQVHALALDPQSGALFAATETGLYRSDSAGNFQRIGESSMAPILSIATAPDDPGRMAIGVYRRGLFLSDDGGKSWNPAGDIFAGRLSPTGEAFDPQNGEDLLARVLFGRIFKSTDRGQDWHSVWAGMPDVAEVETMAIAPGDPTLVYAGANDGFYSSANAGESWTPGGLEDLTVFSLWVDPHDPRAVLAGATDGLYRTADAGKTWTPAGLAPMSVTALARDRRGNLYGGTKYAGAWTSADDGKTWRPLDGGMGETSVVALVVDDARDLLYAATSHGIFRMNLGRSQ